MPMFKKGTPEYEQWINSPKGVAWIESLSKATSGEHNPNWKGGKEKSTCVVCGKQIEYPSSRKKQFCSTVCRGMWRSQNIIGDKSSNWKGGQIKKVCKICGKPVHRFPSQLHKNIYCSRECSQKDLSNRPRGKTHYNYRNASIECKCPICGTNFYEYPSRIKDGRGKTCSKECQSIYKSKYDNRIHNKNIKNSYPQRVPVKCVICGNINEYSPSEAKRRKCCSRECVKIYWSLYRNKRHNPNIDRHGTIEKKCIVCGNPFVIPKSTSDKRITCSKECADSLKRRTFTEDEKKSIISAYVDGCPKNEIVKKFNIPMMTLTRYSKKWGVQMRGHYRKHIYEEHYFDIIDTPDKAYFLGLFYADGCISSTGHSAIISLSGEEDKHILYELENLVGGKIRNVDPNIYNKKWNHKKPLKPQCILSINNKHICERLEFNGCYQAKSLDCHFPSWLESTLLPHFVRGYFDGDGSIRFKFGQQGQIAGCTVDITGSIPFCEELYQYLVTQNIIPHKYIKDKVAAIAFSNLVDCEKFCDWIYRDCSNLRLNRKYSRYLQLKESMNKRRDQVL